MDVKEFSTHRVLSVMTGIVLSPKPIKDILSFLLSQQIYGNKLSGEAYDWCVAELQRQFPQLADGNAETSANKLLTELKSITNWDEKDMHCREWIALQEAHFGTDMTIRKPAVAFTGDSTFGGSRGRSFMMDEGKMAYIYTD